jgi:hypothetical protein
MVSPVAKYIVAVGLDGRISSQGTLEQALATDSKLRAEVEKEKKVLAEKEEVINPTIKKTKVEGDSSKGKLIVAEEVALGRVSWPACKFLIDHKYLLTKLDTQ